MTNLEDALVAVDAGADAVGFVFYEKSPRLVSEGTVQDIVAKLPEAVEKIGVMVDGDEVDWFRVLSLTGLTGWQTYWSFEGRKSPGPRAVGLACLPKRYRHLMAMPMNLLGDSDTQIPSLASNFANWGKNLPADFPLPEGLLDTMVLDSGDLRAPGGTGKTFDWKKAVPLAEGMRQGKMKLVVAGGLNPENVVDAIKTLKPWGVDVVSGVEASPGKKDPQKVRAFVNAVRAADKSA